MSTDKEVEERILESVSGQLSEAFDEFVIVGRTVEGGLDTCPGGRTFIHCQLDSFPDMQKILKRDLTKMRNVILEDEVREDEGFD